MRIKEMHRVDTNELETRLDITQQELKQTLASREAMEQELATSFKKLR